MTTAYTNLYDITELQQRIMRFIDYWASTEKTPISQQEIVREMERRKKKYGSVAKALEGLLKLGYIRKAIIVSNKVYYVQLRSI